MDGLSCLRGKRGHSEDSDDTPGEREQAFPEGEIEAQEEDVGKMELVAKTVAQRGEKRQERTEAAEHAQREKCERPGAATASRPADDNENQPGSSNKGGGGRAPTRGIEKKLWLVREDCHKQEQTARTNAGGLQPQEETQGGCKRSETQP